MIHGICQWLYPTTLLIITMGFFPQSVLVVMFFFQCCKWGKNQAKVTGSKQQLASSRLSALCDTVKKQKSVKQKLR